MKVMLILKQNHTNHHCKLLKPSFHKHHLVYLLHLFDLAIKFYKFLRHITNYKVAKKVLELLENSFNENQNKISIENIAEKIYKDDDFYTSMKLAILNLIQKQEPLVLEYVSKNRVKLENEFSKRASKLIKKSDFMIPSIA